LLCVLGIASITHTYENAEQADVVDEILVTIYSDQGKQNICISDIRPWLDGSPRTLNDVVFDRLKLLDAQSLGLEVSEEKADQFLANIQHKHNMTRDQVEDLFSQLGYTYEEGREMLREQQMIERIVEYRVSSDRRLLVQRADIQAYDDARPAYQQGSYVLQCAIIPHDTLSPETIRAYIDDGDIDAIAHWDAPFTISDAELAQERRFIEHEKPGAIVDVEDTHDATEVTRLVDKQEKKRVPIEARYEEIAQKLRMQQYETVLAEYHNRLLNEAVVRCTYDEDRSSLYPAQ